MNDKKYTWLLYIIVTTILLTIVVQCYWNYKNYLLNKQNFINQVQVSLDNALDTYYADLAESNEMTLIDIDTLNYKDVLQHKNSDSLILNVKKEHISLKNKDISGFSQITDSIGYTVKKGSNQISKIKVLRGKRASDSLKLMKGITSIFISIKNDTLDFTKLTPVLNTELKRKHLDINYALKHFKNDSIFNSYNSENIQPDFLKTNSKSTFLKKNEQLEINYSNATTIILKQGLNSILISTLLVLAVISCLFYLLKIIQKQKQLAEVKNDLISNITHEFKTPIATIGVALESISNFNVINDKEKTKKYVDISSNQLSKLNVMVEKLLETATLDSETLELNKEEIDLVALLETLFNNYKIQHQNKTFTSNIETESLLIHIDSFHFENALNNILDNAVKYGGNKISVDLFTKENSIEILISDNGNTLNKDNKTRVFEKFYRIPKGNTHDVKGFGIGLYYTKSIIEKHKGAIQLDLKNNLTTFKISLPNG
ncbi:two-component system, OmpR family, phosphate regulon sensor histidine kinase PhoR [Flaviramulus basaltis]|uniref:histidine kinase n=1 Tax=Flaviramulus basaltis TaxID=369401 RepID=A0A1K2IF67_9FLAO|nr:ATP-binding protein [Flaviramulus basaltis]SFZ90898.1 two-component system, OmpR family, phosphate regulon sensor histidine kinase PhoR [Flaviramulus basaltis]